MHLLAKCQKVYKDLRCNEPHLTIMKTRECSLCYPVFSSYLVRGPTDGRFLRDKLGALALCLTHHINSVMM